MSYPGSREDWRAQQGGALARVSGREKGEEEQEVRYWTPQGLITEQKVWGVGGRGFDG